MSKTRRMAQRRSRKHGTFMWKTVTIPNLRFNTEKIKKVYAIEHKYFDLINRKKGNVANFVTLPSNRGGKSVVQKEVYMPFIERNKESFMRADRFYNRSIRKLGGTVVNDKSISDLIKEKARNGNNKKV